LRRWRGAGAALRRQVDGCYRHHRGDEREESLLHGLATFHIRGAFANQIVDQAESAPINFA
jgi:hypothetical protein